MQFVKKLGRVFAGLVFRIGLIGLVILGPLVMVFGTANQIKKSLAESLLYDKAITAIIDSSAEGSTQEPDSPFSQPAVQEAAKKAVSPSFVQTTVESIVDGAYGWLQGKTQEPEFSIDASSVKERFITSVGDYAIVRANKLPTCTSQQLRQLGPEIDPLTIQCLPPGYETESLRPLIAAELDKQTGEGNLLQQTTISPETLPKDENGQTPVQKISQDLKHAPEAYRWATLGPWILVVIIILAGVTCVLLYDDKRIALRNISITLIIFGGLTLLGILISNFIFGKLEDSKAVTGVAENLKQPILDLVQSLRVAINQKLLLFGGVYALLGAGLFAVLHFTKTKVSENTDKPASIPKPAK